MLLRLNKSEPARRWAEFFSTGLTGHCHLRRMRRSAEYEIERDSRVSRAVHLECTSACQILCSSSSINDNDLPGRLKSKMGHLLADSLLFGSQQYLNSLTPRLDDDAVLGMPPSPYISLSKDTYQGSGFDVDVRTRTLRTHYPPTPNVICTSRH